MVATSELYGIPTDVGMGATSIDQSFGGLGRTPPAQFIPNSTVINQPPGMSAEVRAIIEARRKRMKQLSGMSSGLNFGTKPTVFVGDEMNTLFKTQNNASLLGS